MQIHGVTSDTVHVYLNLCQAYEAEFSAITGKKPDHDGRFALDTELGGDVCGYLLYQDLSPVGFAAVRHLAGKNEICEFYVAPSMRGHSLGKAFAHGLFRLFPGSWEVKQLLGANLATCFWQQTISEFTGGRYDQDMFEDCYWGRVVRQCFMSPYCPDSSTFGPET